MFSYHPKSLTWQTALAPKQQPAPTTQPSHSQNTTIFHRLPAELRNKIYIYVFMVDDASIVLRKSSRSPHPLSLLLTCRQIYHEANALAFSTYTFPIRHDKEATYASLKASTSVLSRAQISAITSLAVLVHDNNNNGAVLANALLILPSLRDFVILTTHTETSRACKSAISVSGHFTPPIDDATSDQENLAAQAVNKYAPPILLHTLHTVATHPANARHGKGWAIEWHQLRSELCYARIERDADGRVWEELCMDCDAVGVVYGVEACACGSGSGSACGNVIWTAAELVQEGGGWRVRVRVVFYGAEYAEDIEDAENTKDVEGVEDTKNPQERKKKEEIDGKDVRLIPGTAPSRRVIVRGDAGMGFEADAEYWEALRRRNGNLGALWRGLWR